MTQTENKLTEAVLPIDKGHIILEPKSIIIQDREKREMLSAFIASGCCILFGVISVLRYLRTGDKFLLWSGVLIGVGHAIMFLMYFFRSSKQEVQLSEIKSVKFKERFGKRFLDISLKGGKVRRIRNIAAVSQELEQYFATNRLLAK